MSQVLTPGARTFFGVLLKSVTANVSAGTRAGSETMPRVETMFVFRTTGPLIA